MGGVGRLLIVMSVLIILLLRLIIDLLIDRCNVHLLSHQLSATVDEECDQNHLQLNLPQQRMIAKGDVVVAVE